MIDLAHDAERNGTRNDGFPKTPLEPIVRVFLKEDNDEKEAAQQRVVEEDGQSV